MARVRAVLKAADKNAGYCYKKAHAAKARASKALSGGVRKFYLEIEARWLCRAASYEHAERLAGVVARLSALPKMPFCPTCDAPMRPNGVGCGADLIEYYYECAACEAKKTVIEIDRMTTSWVYGQMRDPNNQNKRGVVIALLPVALVFFVAYGFQHP
jgi:hypothetical protein